MNKETYNVIVRESLNTIREAYINNCLSIFAGAGVSKDSGMPSWDRLMSDIRKTLGSSDDREDYLKIAEKFYIQFRESYYEKLSKFISNDNKEANDIHKIIIKLNVRNIITTNWDNLLEKAIDAIESKKDGFGIISQDSDLNNMAGKSYRLIKMHGSLDKRNIVFTETDYLEYSRISPS